ncbi:MAG: RNA methyltransferase [Ruminococcus sp.]|nr:RNA methyltransferase [Ruminococcus sp.]
MNIQEIKDLSLPELIPYKCTSEVQLMHYCEPDYGIFIAESPKVIRRALDAGYEPISMLMEKKYISGQAGDIINRCKDITVYTAQTEILTELTGFKLTQGALCAMRRKQLPTADDVIKNSSRIAVLEDIMNQTNIGAIFRSAAALGFDAVLLTTACSDPLYRRSIRVSMGTVFQIKWAYLDNNSPEYINFLRDRGFITAAMALRNDNISIDDKKLNSAEKLAVILGTEGEGLKEKTIQSCDYCIKIPMSNGVDSLNVAAASAVAFWQLRKK